MDKAIMIGFGICVLYSFVVWCIRTRQERKQGTTCETVRTHTRRVVSHVVDGLVPILVWELIMKPAVMVAEHADTVASVTHH